MMNKKPMLIFYFFVGCILVISIFIREKDAKNGFKRKINQIIPEVEQSFHLESRYFYIADYTNNSLILKNNFKPWICYTMDFNFNGIKMDTLGIPNNLENKISRLSLQVKAERFYVHVKSSKRLIVLKKDSATFKSFNISDLHFDQFCISTPNSIFVRSVKLFGNSRNREIIKLSLTDTPLILSKIILPKQIDGYFCNDGLISYNEPNNKIIYMYYYKGEFLVTDSNLNIKIKAKTIDTINKANFKIKNRTKKLNDGTMVESITQVGIPTMVNRCYTSDSNYLYIISGIKADNESLKKFKENEIIDIYSIKNGHYICSFYINKYKKNRIKQFFITKNRIYAIFGNYLVSLSFNPKLIN